MRISDWSSDVCSSDPTTMTTYFTDKGFRFLRALARNTERAWFQAHKADYEAHVRGPFQALLADLQPALHTISEHYRSEPKTVGGSRTEEHPSELPSLMRTSYNVYRLNTTTQH